MVFQVQSQEHWSGSFNSFEYYYNSGKLFNTKSFCTVLVKLKITIVGEKNPLSYMYELTLLNRFVLKIHSESVKYRISFSVI